MFDDLEWIAPTSIDHKQEPEARENEFTKPDDVWGQKMNEVRSICKEGNSKLM
jgi:hypothetical protein